MSYEALLSLKQPRRKRGNTEDTLFETLLNLAEKNVAEDKLVMKLEAKETRIAPKKRKVKAVIKDSEEKHKVEVKKPRQTKEEKRTEGHRLTEEQQAFVDSKMPLIPGKLIKVVAIAGSGKTSSLKAFIAARKKVQFLYLVFNKNMCSEAMKKFKSFTNVNVKTYHGLAYSITIQEHGYKLFMPMKGSPLRFYNQAIQKFMKDSGLYDHFATRYKLHEKFAWDEKEHMWEHRALWNHTMWTIDKFCSSGDTEVKEDHCVKLKELIKKREHADEIESDSVRRRILSGYLPDIRDVVILAKYIVNIIVTKQFKIINQQLSIKLLHLLNPDLSTKYQVFALDEAQDALGVMIAVMKQQKMAWMVVGDPLQSINSWMGATSAINKLSALVKPEDQEEYLLSESFRFGPAVADFCNKMFAKVRYKLKKPISSRVSPNTKIVEVKDDPTEIAKYIMLELPNLAPKDKKTLKIGVISRTKHDILTFMNAWMDEIARLDLNLQNFNLKCSAAIKSSLDDMIKVGKLTDGEIRKQLEQLEYQNAMDPHDEDVKSKIKMIKFIKDRTDRKRYVQKLDILIHPRKNRGVTFDSIDAAEEEAESKMEDDDVEPEVDEEALAAEEAEFLASIQKPIRAKRASLEGFYSEESDVEDSKTAPIEEKKVDSPIETKKPAFVPAATKPKPVPFKGKKVHIELSTIHASKGLEYDYVVCLGIARELEILQERAAQVAREAITNKREKKLIVYQHALYLIYVLVTRCISSIFIPSSTYNFVMTT